MLLPAETGQTECSGDLQLGQSSTALLASQQTASAARLYFHQVPRQRQRLGNKGPDANSKDPNPS